VALLKKANTKFMKGNRYGERGGQKAEFSVGWWKVGPLGDPGECTPKETGRRRLRLEEKIGRDDAVYS